MSAFANNGHGSSAPVFLTGSGSLLPNEPIASADIEHYIGSVGPNSSSLRDKVIANSGIRSRHYAIDRQQRSTHSCTSMAARAIERAVAASDRELADVELLAVATTMGDTLAPGIASMVHGELGNPPCEIASLAGICASGMMALKTACLHVKAGEKHMAVAAASEFSSRLMKSSRFVGQEHLDADGNAALEIAFLRYMLSDGAGAFVVEDRPRRQGVSLRVDWVTLTSYADRTDTCMSCGTLPEPSGEANGALGEGEHADARHWLDFATTEMAAGAGAMALRQKMRLLPGLLRVAAEEYERIYRAGMFEPECIKHFLVHYSSEILKPAGMRALGKRGVPMPAPERWRSNLSEVGNMGCASIYVMLDELMSSGTLQPGDRVLMLCPESGRYAISYAHLTAVDANGSEG